MESKVTKQQRRFTEILSWPTFTGEFEAIELPIYTTVTRPVSVVCSRHRSTPCPAAIFSAPLASRRMDNVVETQRLRCTIALLKAARRLEFSIGGLLSNQNRRVLECSLWT